MELEQVEETSSSLLNRWLDDESDLFRPTESREVIVPWLTFQIVSAYEAGGTVIDLGGGFSLTNGVLAQLEMEAHVVDLLADYYPHSTLKTDCVREVEFLESQGVQFLKADLNECDLRDSYAPGSVDVICSFHALEHLHHSPRSLLESAMDVLKPGGRVVIEVPNHVNALKRLRVVLGRTNDENYRAFWEEPVFVGHVREYTVGDLQVMAQQLRLDEVNIRGKNYYGALYQRVPLRAAGVVDRMLQVRPGLCGSLFLFGRKGSATTSAGNQLPGA